MKEWKQNQALHETSASLKTPINKSKTVIQQKPVAFFTLIHDIDMLRCQLGNAPVKQHTNLLTFQSNFLQDSLEIVSLSTPLFGWIILKIRCLKAQFSVSPEIGLWNKQLCCIYLLSSEPVLKYGTSTVREWVRVRKRFLSNRKQSLCALVAGPCYGLSENFRKVWL